MKKGFSLVEIIISVGLIAIVMLFLFQILSDLQYEETSSNFAAGNQMNRANLIKKVEDDFNARFVKRVKLNKNDDNSVITISFQEGNSSTLTITPKTISYKNGNLEEGKNVFTYKIEDDNYEYDSDIKITSDLQSGNLTTVNLFCEDEDSNCGTSQFHYVKIRIPVKNIKTTDNNAQDDIELFYVGPFVENANKYKKFTLVSSALNTSLRIERISSKREEADLGKIRNGDFVYEQDELKISAEANTGYTNVLITVNDSILTGERIYKVKDNEAEGEVSVTASASLQEFRTTLQGNDDLPVTIDRISSDKEGANKGIISIDDTLYYGDRLKISVGNPNEAQYENLSLKVNNASFESGREIVITSPLQISREASVRSYVQTIKTRFQNADGTWGEYSTAYEETKSYGDSVSYSVDANNTYAAASIPSYQVTGPKTVQLDIPRRTSTNIIQVRYQNADGTYGAYSNAKSETLRVGETISWSRGEDATYVAASSSITATHSDQTKQISVNRRTYVLTVNKGTGISSVSGGGTYRAGQTVSISASMNSGYRFVNWTKNAGTLANANASSTTFTMPTSAATVTANGVADGLLPQMTRYYTGYEIYRDYSGTGVDRYAAAWSANSANTTNNSISTYSKVNNGKNLWIYAKRNYLASEKLNNDDYEGRSGLVSANKVNLSGKSKIVVKAKLSTNSPNALAANIQCDLQIKYSTSLPSWTDGNDRNTRTAAGKTFRTFANSYTQFSGAKEKYSSSTNASNKDVTVTGTFSGLNDQYYIMVVGSAYSNSQYYVDCTYSIESVTVS